MSDLAERLRKLEPNLIVAGLTAFPWMELCAVVEAIEREMDEAPEWRGESFVLPPSWFAYRALARRMDEEDL
jgi:hypothetical protein